jgi:hypothetical protein
MPEEKATKAPVEPNKNKPEPDQNEEEEIDIRIEKPREELLNLTSSVFDGGIKKRFGGINTDSSIFEKGVLFNTNNDNEE